MELFTCFFLGPLFFQTLQESIWACGIICLDEHCVEKYFELYLLLERERVTSLLFLSLEA
jgi:hypothetical protein